MISNFLTNYFIIPWYLLPAALCILFITFTLIQKFIFEYISRKKLRYERTSLVVDIKFDVVYLVGVLYHKQAYYFYNKKLYDSVEIGDMLCASVCKKQDILYVKDITSNTSSFCMPTEKIFKLHRISENSFSR